MAKGSTSTDVLIVDDEPEFLAWVEDFLASKGLAVNYATNLPDALRRLSEQEYRLILVDMNIPHLDAVPPRIRERSPLADRYPGIAVVATCRNLGYGAHAVVAYTVHDDDAADAELAKYHCRYVLKGRPQVLKRVLESSLGSVS